MEIKPIKIVKGQGFAQLLTEKEVSVNCVEENHDNPNIERDWYKDTIYYLKKLICHDYLVDHQRRALRIKSSKYVLMQDGLGWKNPDGIILKCVNLEESKVIIRYMHYGLCSGHYVPRTTAAKIVREGYYWPMLYKDVHYFVRSCQECQFFTRKPRLHALPLNPIIIEAPFQQWGMDFVGPFDQNSTNGFKYILTCTNYFTC